MEATSRKASDAIVPDAQLPTPKTEAKNPDGPAVHVHPTGIVEEVFGVDEQGRRQLRIVPDRTPTYISTCKGCKADDKARMAAPPSPKVLEHLEQTLFLIPEPEYDALVARAYIATRYPDAGNIVCAFHAEKLSYVKGAQVVVVTRRGINGKQPGPRSKRTKDEEGTFYDQPIPPDTYLAEIVESEPIIVADCMDVVPATMFSEQSVDMREFTARLAERAHPFRIAPPSDPKDRMYVMRLNS